MGRRSKKKTFSITSIFEGLKEETVQGIWAILLFVLTLFLVLAAFGSAGIVGDWIYTWLTAVLGIGYFLIPIVFALLAISLLSTLQEKLGWARGIGSLLFVISGLGLIEIVLDGRGGFVGNLISMPLVSLFEIYATILILGAVFVISVLVLFDIRPSLEPLYSILERIRSLQWWKKDTQQEAAFEIAEPDDADEDGLFEEDEEYEDQEKPVEEDEDEVRETPAAPHSSSPFNISLSTGASYTHPPLSLFDKDKGKPGVGDVKANVNIIKRTLQNFGISVEMDEVSIGPSVTRYALKPAEGVRLSKIVGLQNNLELALAASPVRIEAPIPGKSLVGIEVPNHSRSTIGFGSLISKNDYQESQKPLLLALGKDIAGKSHFADLGKMPHLLIAGATGSGKSVTIHAIIASLLYRNSPQQLRFIMVDPKRVELTLYKQIPHLLTPVVTDAKKTILALKWAAKEMERRYDVLEAEQVRDIDSYHKNILAPSLEKAKKKGDEETELPEPMPYIVIVIDELADIMQIYPRELEAAIVRLAQMSRAVGIHLILSTQRPSVNVITGLIKANIPARIAMQVASQIDSRTILDAGGAERLLGAGDMLYLSGEMSKPKRLQSAFITESETKKLAAFLRKNNEEEPLPELDLSDATGNDLSISDANGEEEDEPLYEDAKEEVVRSGRASTSYLQRRFRIGYSRAARLIDMLEDNGVIGPPDGSKQREILQRPADNLSQDEHGSYT